jgi:hypothetical protein
MTIEVKQKDGSAAFTPVAGPDGDGGLAKRCVLTCEVHNRDFPDDPWTLHVDSKPVATDEVTEAIIAKLTVEKA